MPSITPSYLYTFVALIAVSTLLVFSFIAYVDVLRFSSEIGQLTNLMDRVASKGTELLMLTMTTNATSEASIQMPTAIGSKHYWLKICSDSSRTWLEGGFGNKPVEGTELRVYLPNEASATGSYIGGYGAAYLKCYVSAGVPHIQLTSLNGSGWIEV